VIEVLSLTVAMNKRIAKKFDSSESVMSIGENRLACQEKIWGIKNIDLDKFLLHDKFHI
jgi:hypothetical protein